ncbi:MAG: outer membrane beta-barrel protein, partial [Gemmatimonadetes bacterium]|nr:outer membrane beta-barrel protein [Gemmatimonadota bacterium]
MRNHSRPRRALLFAAFAVFALSQSATAGHPKGDIGVLGGLVFSDEDVVGHGAEADDQGLGIGLMVNHFLSSHWAINVDGIYTSLGGQPEQFGDATQMALRVGPRVFVPTVEDRLSFYGDVALGYAKFSFDAGEDISRPILSVAAGQRFQA